MRDFVEETVEYLVTINSKLTNKEISLVEDVLSDLYMEGISIDVTDVTNFTSDRIHELDLDALFPLIWKALGRHVVIELHKAYFTEEHDVSISSKETYDYLKGQNEI